MNKSDDTKATPLLDDQPSSEDLLGFEPYAAALANIILHPDAATPLIVGLFGRWGTGKTSLMYLLEAKLKSQQVPIVWFNAWRHGQDEEIGASLLKSLLLQLPSRLRLTDQLRFSVGLLRRGVAWDRLPLHLPMFLLRVFIVLAPAAAGVAASLWTGDIPLRTAFGTLGFGASLVLFWHEVKPIFTRLGAANLPGIPLYREMDFEEHIGVLERLHEQFIRLISSLPREKSRIVIFIDDLDRCDPDNALQLLDSIKLFLNVERCVFVIGLDGSVVQKALENRYPEDSLAQREYLRKIIQLPFHLPPPTPDDLANYVELLNVRFPDDRCGRVILGSASQNPREIKRLINTFSLHWSLGLARPGLTLKPVRLAKIVIIQQTFEQLYWLLRERPEWLGLLETAMRRSVGESTTSIPPSPPLLIENVTVAVTPTGINVPPAIMSFLQDERLRQLLTADVVGSPEEDDANFCLMTGDEIAAYFTFGVRPMTGIPAGAPPGRPQMDAQPSSMADSTAPPFASTSAAPSFGSLDESLDFGEFYQVVRRIGTGGIGEVFLARDRITGAEVAIKRLHLTLSREPAWIERFAHEAELLEHLPSHPSIVRIIDASHARVASPAGLFYVMERTVGPTLEALLKESPMPLGRLRLIFAPLFDGLAHIHASGVIHGDIKPSSIVLTAAGFPKLVDFGLAFRAEEGSKMTSEAGFTLATPAYASPEQLAGRTIDARSDLFSLGAVLYECATGQKPFGATNQNDTADPAHAPVSASELNPTLPFAMDSFFQTLLARDPEQRFASAPEARDAFLAVIGVDTPSVA